LVVIEWRLLISWKWIEVQKLCWSGSKSQKVDAGSDVVVVVDVVVRKMKEKSGRKVLNSHRESGQTLAIAVAHCTGVYLH
jgi:hypothetical protein